MAPGSHRLSVPPSLASGVGVSGRALTRLRACLIPTTRGLIANDRPKAAKPLEAAARDESQRRAPPETPWSPRAARCRPSDRPLPTLHDLPMAGPLNAQEFIRALKASSDPPYAGGPPKIEVARKAWDNVSLYVPNKAEAIVDWILSALLKEKSRQPFVYLPLPHIHRLTQRSVYKVRQPYMRQPILASSSRCSQPFNFCKIFREWS